MNLEVFRLNIFEKVKIGPVLLCIVHQEQKKSSRDTESSYIATWDD